MISLRVPRWPDSIWIKEETNQFTLSWPSGGWSRFEDFTVPFRMLAFVHLSDQPPQGEGIHVRAQWMGRDWHFFSRPTNATDSAYASRAVTALDLPLSHEPADLVVSSAMFGGEVHRRLRITPEFPTNVLPQLERNFTNKFLAPEKFQALLLTARTEAAKDQPSAEDRAGDGAMAAVNQYRDQPCSSHDSAGYKRAPRSPSVGGWPSDNGPQGSPCTPEADQAAEFGLTSAGREEE